MVGVKLAVMTTRKRIVVPFRDLFSKFLTRIPTFLYMGVPPPPGLVHPKDLNQFQSVLFFKDLLLSYNRKQGFKHENCCIQLHKTSQLLWMQSPKSPKHILLLWASSNIHGIHGMQGKARWHFQFASQICAPTFELSHNVIPKPKVSFNKRIWKQNPIKWSEVLKS